MVRFYCYDYSYFESKEDKSKRIEMVIVERKKKCSNAPRKRLKMKSPIGRKEF